MNTLAATKTLTLVRRRLNGSVDPLALWANSHHFQKAYWAAPEEDFEFAALGAARTFRAEERQGRFASVREALDTLNLQITGDSGPEFSSGVLVGGFAFSDRDIERHPDWTVFGGGELVLPEVFVVRSKGSTWLTHVEGVNPPPFTLSFDNNLGWVDEVNHRDDAEYLGLVSRALALVNDQEMTKVVTARSLSVPARLNPAAVLERLKIRHPSCATFAIAHGTQIFLGASPEKLVNTDENRVETAALAGSRPRHEHPGADARFRAELLSSPKERHEHDVVVSDITEALTAAGVALDPPASTGVMKLRRIQHLHTPIAGTVPHGTHILDLVCALHPTPAVAGLPRQRAQDWIDQNESMDRGWYAAPVGWMTLQGHGQFRVALRSALLDEHSLTLFAGGGIVDGAEPHHELAETATKFEAVLGALDLTP